MKNVILLVCFLPGCLCSQNTTAHEGQQSTYNLFVSAGLHGGFWSVGGMSEMPYNIQIDKLLKNRLIFGVGYSYDHYTSSALLGEVPAVRQNIRLRFLWLSKHPEGNVNHTIGFSAGVSDWQEDTATGTEYSQNMMMPTFQFLYGIHVTLSETTFWLTEFGIGAPYMLQTSLGFKF